MKEQELFDWLKAGHYSDLEKSSKEYDGFDCTSGHYKMFIELKSRNTHYDTLLLETLAKNGVDTPHLQSFLTTTYQNLILLRSYQSTNVSLS